MVVQHQLADSTGAPWPSDRPLRLGDRAALLFRIEAPQGARVFVPSNPSLGPLRPRGSVTLLAREAKGDRVTETHLLPVTALRMGAKAVPPVEIPYQLADGAAGSLMTPRLPVRITGRLTNEQDPSLGAPPGPVPVIATSWLRVGLLIAALVGLLATLVTLAALRVMGRRRRAALPPPPPRPADEVALEALDWLAQAPLDPLERYTRTVDVLRQYLGGRFGFDGLELTTRETMLALMAADLRSVTRPELEGTLSDADLVKFAKIEPSEADAMGMLDQVRHVVVRTWLPPEVKAAPEAPAGAAP